MFWWCPRTRSVVGSTETPHLAMKLLRMAAQESNIGIWDSFPGFRRHGARGEVVGEGESMVSPCAGDMEPPWGPFFSRRDTTSQQICTFDCKNTLCCSPITAPWGRGEGGRVGTVGVPVCGRHGTCMGTLSFFARALLKCVICKKHQKRL
jgi:hypothetical protein